MNTDIFIKVDLFYKLASKPSLDDVKSPKDLLSWMDCIRYGWMDKNKKKHTKPSKDWFGQNWWDNYLFMPPSLLEKTKVGSCYEQAIFASHILDKLKINNKVIFVAHSDKKIDEDANTHMFVVFKDNGKWFWFEHSWGEQKGIHGPFKSIKDIKEKIIKINKSKYVWFTKVNPDDFNKKMTGKNCYEAVNFPGSKDW